METEQAARVTLEVDGLKITVPNNLSDEQRQILIGFVVLSNEYTDTDKCKIIEALITFGRTQVQ